MARPSQMSLVAFLQASNVSVYSGSWRYPSATEDFGDLRHYARIARVLEEGTFDLMFFDDRLAMPAIYADSTDDAVRYGARPVKLDLAAVLGGCAAVTDRLGLGATYSTTYYPPFHVARTFATLDQLTRGRSAWNIVTSINDAEARNFGQDIHLGHDERYDRAEEFVDVVRRLWDSWEDDALVQDRDSGIFADPAKVHELHHHGEYFDVRGPLTVPRSPQGRPVLLQAGSSGRGRDFAARHAELIFTGDPSREVAAEHYRDQKDRIATAGRDPDAVRILPMAYTVVGETETIAQEKEELLLDRLVHPMASLTLLSELLNHDFSGHGLDDEVTDELIAGVSGLRGLAEGVRAHTAGQHGGGETLTLRTLAAHRATLLQGPRFVGTGAQVAEQMQDWFDPAHGDPACDGFVLAATHFPGSFEDVTRMVVPELRRRGVFRHAYPGTTLRDTLGLPRPERVGP